MKNKYIHAFSGVFIISIIIAILASVPHNTGTIRIGGLFPLTGGLASYGEPAHNAAMLAIADMNANGGVAGRKVELVSEDHSCDPKKAVSAYDKLVSIDHTTVITAVACTGTVIPLIPELSEQGIVMMGTITSGNKLTGISSNFYRNWASDGQEARLLAERAKTMGYKKIGAIYEETDYAKGLVLSLSDDLKDTGISVVSESFVSGTSDVRSQLTKLAAEKADAIFVSVQTVTSGEVVLTQMEQLNVHPKALFINDNILKAPELLKKHSQLVEGAVGGDYVFAETSALKNMLARYKLVYGAECPQINICAAEYDAVYILTRATAQADGSVSNVKNYLSSLDYNGLSGNISFNGKNDRSNALYSLFIVKDASPVKI